MIKFSRTSIGFVFCAVLSAQNTNTAAVLRPTPQAEPDGRPYHLVREGDTILTIAATYHLKVQRLIDLNGIKSNTILLGQKVYLAPEGAKVDLPQDEPAQKPKNKHAASGKSENDMEPQAQVLTDSVPPEEDFVASSGKSQVEDTSDASQHALRSSPKTFAPPTGQPSAKSLPYVYTGGTVNPDSGRPTPSDRRHWRNPIPKPAPPLTNLVDVMVPLPLLAKDEARSTWTPRQNTIATWWERKAVHTQGILRSQHWTVDSNGASLILLVTPNSGIRQAVQVTIPGAYLPPEISLSTIRRWADNGAPVEVLGHLGYMDGGSVLDAIRAGDAMSPWEIIATTVRVHDPAGRWEAITLEPGDPAPSKDPSPIPEAARLQGPAPQQAQSAPKVSQPGPEAARPQAVQQPAPAPSPAAK